MRKRIGIIDQTGEVKNRLRELRERAGMRQVELARLAGVNNREVCVLEKNEKLMSIRYALLFSRILGCSLDEMYDIPWRKGE